MVNVCILGDAVHSISSGITKNHEDNGIFKVYGSTGIIGYSDKYDYEGEKILVARVGANAGTTNIVSGKYGVSDNTLIINLKVNYESKYIYYILKSQNLSKLVFGSGQPLIRGTLWKRILFFCPENKEQQKIAEALSDMDNLISSLEKLIEKKKAIKQGAMQELLTGKKRLSGFGGEWKNFCVGKMGDFYGGLSGKTKKDFDHGTAHYITFLNVLSNVKIDTSILATVDVHESENQNAVKKGDLFFNTSSETPEEVGMCAVLDEEIENTYLNSFCFGFRMKNNEHNPIFLSYYLNSSIGRKIMSTLAQGATRYNLSKNTFAETIIELPTKEEQTAIASILSDMDAEITALEKKLTKCQKLKQGMMQQLLTGKIRLI